MNNNELLIKLQESLAIDVKEMLDIFKYSDIILSKDELSRMFVYADNEFDDEEDDAGLICDNETLEGFLNGYIISRRGKPELKAGQSSKPPLAIISRKSVNNVVLKKLKVAYSLTNEDIINIFEEVGVTVSKNELTTLFRKQGHKHYKICTDYYLNRFLEGIESRN